MYRNAWPLLAFATYRKILARTRDTSDEVNGHEYPSARAILEAAAKLKTDRDG